MSADDDPRGVDPAAEGGDAGGRPRVPQVEELLGIERSAWRWLARRARGVLHDLPDTVEDPRLARVRAAPAKRLSEGRARRDLAALLAMGGAPWIGLHAVLASAEDRPAALDWLVDGRPPPARSEAAAGAELNELRREVSQLRSRLRSADEQLQKQRERAQARQRERDDARASLQGAEGRLVSTQAQLDELREELATAVAERDAAREALQRADQDAASALAREQRRHEARLRELQEEITALRRAEQERRDAEAAQQRRVRAEAEAQRRAQQQLRDQERAHAQRAVRQGRRGAVARPGRPSVVPDHIAPGSTEYGQALLTPVHWVFVDGYNVTKTLRPDLDDESAERSWLVSRLERLARGQEVIKVFWDGQGSGSERTERGVTQRFSAGEGIADDDVVFEVELAPAEQPILVVTDDQGLRDRLAAHRVDLLHARTLGWLLGS